MRLPIMQKPQKRVLMLADFGCATGFAQVSQNVVMQVLKDTEIDYFLDIIGINYYGLPNEWQGLYPRVRIFPASLISNGDLFGRKGMLNMLSFGVYDILWILQDTFNIEPITDAVLEIRNKLAEKGGKPFKFIFYYPIDAKPKENWIQKSVSKADIPVVYTKYGFDESVKFDGGLKERLLIVPHGIDEKIFRPLDKQSVLDFRHKYFVERTDNKFLVTNINRNQPRKDIARTLQIFRLFKNICPDAILYLHMKFDDVGYNIHEVARNFDLAPDEDYIIPVSFDEHDGIDIQLVNYIYNASDAIMTTSFGEGWGLSLHEAMATKTPVIAPNHTSISELLADDRGILVTTGKSVKDWIVLSNDNERLRPIVDIPEFVDKLVKLRQNRSDYDEMVEKAYQHVISNWTWDKVGEEWRRIFKMAIPSQKKVVIGRNDPCHCGSGEKYKRCHYGKD